MSLLFPVILFSFFKVECNCFTILFQFLLYNMNQLYVRIPPPCFQFCFFFFSLLIWNTLLFPLPTVPLNSTSSRKPSLTAFIILSFALCGPLLVCSPHHAACYLFICLSLLTLKVLEGKVTALLICVPCPNPYRYSMSILWLEMNYTNGKWIFSILPYEGKVGLISWRF